MGRSSSYRPQYYHGAHSVQEEQTDDKTSFFNKAEKQGVALNNNAPFFQTKLNIGGANDQYEKEADAVAGKVVNNNSAGPVVQKKEISSIQRLATSKEEEKPGTNDQRMLRDKEIQEKPEIQRLATPAEDEKLGTNDERMKKDKMIQNKPEIQRVSATAKATAGESASAKATADKSGSTASQSLSSRIESTSGKGNSLPAKTLAEMSRSFGTDFSHVNIHTGSEAVGMNKELSAQAFTHGSDIYFNSGKFDPESSSGKQLLAHELTHVVQQGNNEKIQMQRERPQDCNRRLAFEVNLRRNLVRVMCSGEVLDSLPMSHGMSGHVTPVGDFGVDRSAMDIDHHSSEYGECLRPGVVAGRGRRVGRGQSSCHAGETFVGADMDYFIPFTTFGGSMVGFHVGSTSRESHGCIHLSRANARWLWRLVQNYRGFIRVTVH